MSLAGVIAALRLGGVTIYPLMVLAVVAVVVVLEKAYLFATRARPPARLLARISASGVAWDALDGEVDALDRRNGFVRFYRVIAAHREQPVWWVESRAAEEASRIEQSLGRWLWVLETIVTAAPLLGLLGTIVGMIRAFRLFGTEGLVDPRGVTGGVAEALVATAAGLFIAIGALLAFNYFSQRLAAAMDAMEQLGTRLVDALRLAAEQKAP